MLVLAVIFICLFKKQLCKYDCMFSAVATATSLSSYSEIIEAAVSLKRGEYLLMTLYLINNATMFSAVASITIRFISRPNNRDTHRIVKLRCPF